MALLGPVGTGQAGVLLRAQLLEVVLQPWPEEHDAGHRILINTEDNAKTMHLISSPIKDFAANVYYAVGCEVTLPYSDNPNPHHALWIGKCLRSASAILY
jgi:hypothetical protein